MASLSSADQQVWKKVLAAKNKAMTIAQIQASLPGMPEKEIKASLGQLIKAKLLSTEKKDSGVVFHGKEAAEAKKAQTLTQEQSIVLRTIGQHGRAGISAKGLRAQLGTDIITMPTLRKTLDLLEKSGHIKTYKSINATTTPMYILKHLKPPQGSTGGIWFDQNMEYDDHLVQTVSQILFREVERLTWPPDNKRDKQSLALCPNQLYPSARTSKLPTPHHLLHHINKLHAVTVTVKLINVMECMRMLELSGQVEAIKPIGGVIVPDLDEDGDAESDEEGDGGYRGKRRKVDDEDEDEEERERRIEKEKERLKEKKRREKKKERKKEKEKEKEKKRRAKEKKKAKAKAAKRKEKEKAQKKRKKRIDSDDDNDSDDSDKLISIDDSSKKKKKSKSKRKKRSRSESSPSASSGSDSDDSSFASDSDSSDDDDSDADSDSSVSSVSSGSLDYRPVPLKPKTSSAAAAHLENLSLAYGLADQSILTNLTDTAVVYRATRRINLPLGQTQAPCGKCPVFGFCEEDGPVNPVGCGYLAGWLADEVGGWDERGVEMYRPDLIDHRQPEGMDGVVQGGAGGAVVDDQGEEVPVDGNGDYANGYEGAEEGGEAQMGTDELRAAFERIPQ